jgi:outer membrane protein assembly factor BamB
MSFQVLTIAVLSVLMLQLAIAQPAELKPASGGLARCADRGLTGAIPGALAASAGLVFAGTENGAVSAFSSRDLELKWRAELGGEFASELLATADGVVLVTNASGAADRSRLHFISSQSGVTVWTARLVFAEKYFLGRVKGTVAAVSEEGAIFLIDPADGHFIRQFNVKGRVTTRPAFADAGILFGTADGKVHLLTAKGAEFTFDHDSEFKPTSIGFLKDEGFAVGDERGYLAKYGPQDGKAIWKFKGGAAISSVSETADGILITSLDNFVYVLSDYNGDVIWKRRLTGRVLDGGLLLQSTLVSVVYAENTAYVLDAEKGKVLDTISYTDANLVSRVPVRVGDNAFALVSTDGLRTYSVGPCQFK